MTQTSLHWLFLEAFLRTNRELAKKLPEAGLLPGQPKILEFLLTHNGCTQKEISEGCILDKSTVTSLLKRMAEADLVSKQQHPDDQRASLIYLTDAGKQKALWVQKTLMEIDKAALDSIGEEDRQQFFCVLNKIINRQRKW